MSAQEILQKLQEQFGAAIENSTDSYGIPGFYTKPGSLIEILTWLQNHDQIQMNFLTDLTAVHYPDRELPFDVVYHLHSFRHNARLRIKVALPAQPVIQSATSVFSSANWMERETYDFYGIQFTGHPDLRRILNVDEMTIFPMRKEYPLEDNTRKDKNDVMFGREPNVKTQES